MRFVEAQDEMLTMAKDAWDSTSYPGNLFFEGAKSDRPTDQSPWAKAYVRHSTGAQRTLGGVGSRMFDRVGVFIVSVFTPTGKGLSESYQLCNTVADAFEGKSSPGGIWFRNSRINEVGSEGDFLQVNFTVEFVYSEQK